MEGKWDVLLGGYILGEPGRWHPGGRGRLARLRGKGLQAEGAELGSPRPENADDWAPQVARTRVQEAAARAAGGEGRHTWEFRELQRCCENVPSTCNSGLFPSGQRWEVRTNTSEGDTASWNSEVVGEHMFSYGVLRPARGYPWSLCPGPLG